jgi:alpha-galactosidase
LTDSRQVFSVNLPNDGQAPYLPAGAVLECNAIAMGGGFAPVMADPLPAPLVDRLTGRLAAIELTVDAAVTGSRERMVAALLADGTILAEDAADRLARDLIDGHRAHLPQFA